MILFFVNHYKTEKTQTQGNYTTIKSLCSKKHDIIFYAGKIMNEPTETCTRMCTYIISIRCIICCDFY